MSTSIKDVLTGKVAVGETVELRGWVRTRRDSKGGFSFINLHDGSCFDAVQVLARNTLSNYDQVQTLTSGASAIITGEVVESPAKGQTVEVHATQVQVVGLVDDPETYPMAPKRHSMEHLRANAHLRPRTNLIGAATRVRHRLAQSIHQFFDTQGFYWIATPILTASDAEGAGEMFRVSTLDAVNAPVTQQGGADFSQDFFGRQAHLTVSGQLNVECYCLAMSKVYTFGPTFRAENSNTSRHLAEFWMVEPEIAFADLADNAALAEAFLKYVFAQALEHCEDDLAFFQKRVDKTCIDRLKGFIDAPFEVIEYTDAIAILERAAQKEKFEFPVSWGIDLQSEHERYLSEKHVGRPVVVTNYPKDIKAFYMRLNDDGRTVAAMDVLAPGIGEIIGGAQREERLDVLDARLDAQDLPKEDYWWYRDLRRYGSVPHAGFGLGFERLINYVTGIDNIRETIPFPRSRNSIDF